MNKCPLLLRYKWRDCNSGNEVGINVHTGEDIGDWKKCEKRNHEIYKLQLPSSQDFLTRFTGNVIYYCKYEIYAMGDENPVISWFHCSSWYPEAKIQTYCLPTNYTITCNQWYWPTIFLFELKPILQEYERCREKRKTQIFVKKEEW